MKRTIEDEEEEKEVTQDEQMGAFQLSIKVLQNAGFKIRSSLSLNNDGGISINIGATNIITNNPNLGAGIVPPNNGIPASAIYPAGTF